MSLCRPRGLLRSVLALMLAGASSLAAAQEVMTLEEQEALDLSGYRVTDPEAGYFDVASRMALLEETDNAILLQEIDQRSQQGPSCRQQLDYEPITTRLRVPGYYPSPDAWELATEPLFRFEDTVSELAGAFADLRNPFFPWARAAR